MNLSRNVEYSDWLGAAASGLCAIHCTLTPLLIAAKPLLESSVVQHNHGSILWIALDYVFLILSLAAVWYSTKNTTHKGIKWVLWAAWGLFALGIFSEPMGLHFGKWLMYIGSITLVITHIQNYRYCQNRECEMLKVNLQISSE